MAKARRYTIYVPNSMSSKLENAYDLLVTIDSNLSKLIQCLLNSVIQVTKFIIQQKKNYRHYSWHLIIQDKETGNIYSTLKGIKK